MSTGRKIIQLFEEGVRAVDESLMDKVQVLAASSSMKIYDLHNRALGCHCECMGMMSENMMAGCEGSKPTHKDKDFLSTMRKWGLIGEGVQPII